VRFSNLLLIFIVGVVIIGSPLSAYGCRILTPDLLNELASPCEEGIVVIDASAPGVANFLDYTPKLISVVTLTFLTWITTRKMLPMPEGCHRPPLLPPPRLK
jgi:hypothetical protein